MTGEKAAALEPASVRLCSYSLLPGSSLIDDCPPCARPTIMEPLRGVLANLSKTYPNDEAKGFKLGQVRGLWRVDFKQSDFAQP